LNEQLEDFVAHAEGSGDTHRPIILKFSQGATVDAQYYKTMQVAINDLKAKMA